VRENHSATERQGQNVSSYGNACRSSFLAGVEDARLAAEAERTLARLPQIR
jgi:hypothetical protein